MHTPLALSRRVGIIDLGSNSARLMIAHYAPGQAYRITDELSRRVRLSEGLAADGRLRTVAILRAVQAVRLFKLFCDAHGIKRIVPVATAAVRDAANRADVLRQLRAATGLRFRVLTGREEAYYGALGVVNGLGLSSGLVMDVGGGSAEFSRVERGRFRRGETTPLGAVRLTEMFLNNGDHVRPAALRRLTDYVDEALDRLAWLRLAPVETLVGVGGTARALARMDREARHYPFGLLNGYELTRQRLAALVERIIELPVAERPKQLPGLPSDRADIILAGALVVQRALHRARASALVVSGHGLREGLFFEAFLPHSTSPVIRDLRTFSVLNLGRLYGYEAAHAEHVTRLALSLFDQLTERHGYAAEERACLWAAGQLHDIGTVIDYYDHHKHSAYIILNAGLPGYSHHETALIAMLCLYHRKGQPVLAELRAPPRPGDLDRVRRLAALLRLAEYLDRSRAQTITRLRLEGSGKRLRLLARPRPGADARVEIWEAQRSADLFQSAYNCQLVIEPG
ncbi:MAG: Ppx/GppA family phosphatase [Anaerolineales bacterium]|nr:Ppx/GppA family phosphatase [Anaerolineales bacterium]